MYLNIKKVFASFKPPAGREQARHVRRGKGRVRTQDLGHRSGERYQLRYRPGCIWILCLLCILFSLNFIIHVIYIMFIMDSILISLMVLYSAVKRLSLPCADVWHANMALHRWKVPGWAAGCSSGCVSIILKQDSCLCWKIIKSSCLSVSIICFIEFWAVIEPILICQKIFIDQCGHCGEESLYREQEHRSFHRQYFLEYGI